MSAAEGAFLDRWRIGSVTVTAIADGYVAIDPKLLPKATPEEVAPLLEAAGLPQGPVQASINTFVVDLPDRRILVDAGLGPGLADTAGRMHDNLVGTGIAPESVDVILLTHLHRDHVRGITDSHGQAVFPNAEVILHERDHAFWIDEGEESRAPAFAKQYFPIARAALQPYAGRTTTFSSAGEVLPGIQAIHAPGHTPGHTMYRITSEGESLLIAADIAHLPALQFSRPDWSIALDVDPEQAAKTRIRVLDAAVTSRELVTGMHFTGGRAGRFRKVNQSYLFEPEPVC
ncbi:MAG: MBL fold metallo-hydrolase [Pseudorhodoplanes sp.]|jgi:glyoxylase-like metal-dependent hydrolase (beta-lactamase superfamily II)|nr:MBL fold metallo-hydrolase [Pseudorhodoplanes sp.]